MFDSGGDLRAVEGVAGREVSGADPALDFLDLETATRLACDSEAFLLRV